jgi:DNA-binding CsgD family transcriptional regulator
VLASPFRSREGRISPRPTPGPDQIETGPAYHAIPENRLKPANSEAKWHAPKYLGIAVVFATKNWRKSRLKKSEFVLKSGRREVIMVNLESVKVTPQDQQVLNLLVQGCSNKEIAGQLNISPRTVKQHLRTLFLRAGIREGRKRVKLAIAIFSKEEAQS